MAFENWVNIQIICTISIFLFIDISTERGKLTERYFYREKEKDINSLLHLFIHSLVASCMCPDQGWNLQPWRIRTTL